MLLSLFVKYTWKDRLINFALWQRISALVITLVVVYAFLPEERLFNYEYAQDQPWKHEQLLAPFDFGIRKSSQQVDEERQAILDNQLPVFTLDRELTNDILLGFNNEMDALQLECESEIARSSEMLARLLDKGLVQRNSNLENLSESSEIWLNIDRELTQTKLGECLHVQALLSAVSDSLAKTTNESCAIAIQNALHNHVVPNVVYDSAFTALMTKNAMDGLIPIEGLVRSETSIINKGELVNDTKFKILKSLEQEYEERLPETGVFRMTTLGQMLMVLVLLILLMVFIHMNQSPVFNDPRPITLALALLSISFVASLIAFSSSKVSIYVVPIGITPLLLRMFYDYKVSIFTLVILTLILSISVANPLEFIIVQTCALSFATFYQSASIKRSRTLGTALMVFIGYCTIFTIISLAQNGNLSSLNRADFAWFAVNSLLCTLVFPLIYLVEKIFGYVSDTTLVELSESNQPLLRELAIKAPGTFQHSLQVANLCEKVAGRIGGNAVLLRAAALYHDIGKMNEPQFFIENQLPENNPHDDLDPEESAAIIINHVHQGVEYARQHNLPMELIQFIQTHHGRTKVRFFLQKALQKAEATGETVDVELFTYPGPLPKTKEQAILMMADSVEAASRSLKQYDRKSLDELVDRLVDLQRQEGQFDQAPITLKDISEAKIVLKSTLKGIFHQRISYE